MAFYDFEPDISQIPIVRMSAERTAVVTGVAGSGKSWILLRKAKEVSTITNSYAIIVYTKSLKQFFVDELKEIDPSEKHVYYFREWQRSLKSHYTYLFIDECQDFNAEEIADFKSYGTYCWFFGDTDQSIMEFPDHSVQSVLATAEQLGVHTQDLCFNHRLTAENAKIGEYIKPESGLSSACMKKGDKPKLIQVDDDVFDRTLGNKQSQLDKIIDIRANGQLSNVGILVYYNDSVEVIRDYFLAKGIPVEWKTGDGMEIDFKSTNPKIINWHCAKGLQFDDVFIPACGVGEHNFYNKYFKHPVDPVDPKGKSGLESAFYVATTRPMANLYLLYSNDLSPKLPPANSEIYKGNEKEEPEDVFSQLKSENFEPF
ncbi:DNA/RNA helicase [uncultured Parabacteroides sp.]|uniref:DNA/RNA helicase n=1 Tax=uncultured Parabacteroides sp. TaxID=512312 RepID=UPI00263B4E1D|nr:DNA/RNA helicase [uncultured Parabacteroides sp.]